VAALTIDLLDRLPAEQRALLNALHARGGGPTRARYLANRAGIAPRSAGRRLVALVNRELEGVGDDDVLFYELTAASREVLDQATAAPERVDRPAHYTHGSIEPIDVIEDWALGFNLGNAVKYIARAEHKGAPVEDLKKGAWYLQREISRREAEHRAG
jgi:hypothetical protein